MSNKPVVEPVVVKDDHHSRETTHPAYGQVTISRWHGGNTVMFGSELRHNEGISLQVKLASHHRSLNSDRVNGRQIIVDLSFTLAQWAQFVASQGMGDGTPCTLNYYQRGELVDAPRIAAPENHLKKFKREMQEAIDERLEKISAHLERLDAMMDSGEGKKAMRAELKEARRHAHQLPGTVGFINDQFAESMEDIAEKAKTEVEGFVAGMAMRTGLQALQDAAPSMRLLSADHPQES